jgi:hypothetical protein
MRHGAWENGGPFWKPAAVVLGPLLVLGAVYPGVSAQGRLTLLQQKQMLLLQKQQQQLMQQVLANGNAAQQAKWLKDPENQQKLTQFLQQTAPQRKLFFQQQLKQAGPVNKKPLANKLPARIKGPFRVLFIGDSLVMQNNLPAVVAGMAQAVKVPALTVDTVLVGGTTLQMH